jgi:hypothetical protein
LSYFFRSFASLSGISCPTGLVRMATPCGPAEVKFRLTAASAVVFAKACELELDGVVSKLEGGFYKVGEAAIGLRQ